MRIEDADSLIIYAAELATTLITNTLSLIQFKDDILPV